MVRPTWSLKTWAEVSVTLLFSMSPSLGQIVWFEQDFSTLPLSGVWHRASGDWKIDDGLLKISTPGYDQLLSSSFYAYHTSPYSIEVSLRGDRAGLFFCLDDTMSKSLSHMVRFDQRSILTGFFSGAGEYKATNVFDVDKEPTDWTTLRVDIDPTRRTYEVIVDGKAVGIDTTLRFQSGYIGLQASDGTSEFRSLKISSSVPYVRPTHPGPGMPVRFLHLRSVRSQGENFLVHNPELNVFQLISPEGKLLAEPGVPLMPQRAPALNGRIFNIRNGKLLAFDQSGVVVDSITGKLLKPSSIVADSTYLYVADVGSGIINKYESDGSLVVSFSAASAGGLLAPRGIDLYGMDKLVIADYDKLVIVKRDLKDVVPIIRILSSTEASIIWPRNVPDEPVFLYAADGKEWKKKRSDVGKGMLINSVTLMDLELLTRYSFRFSPTLKTIPRLHSLSREYRFATPPQDSSMMLYTRLPVLCMVYRTISYRDVYPADRFPHIPDGRSLSNEELEYLREAVRFNEEFYFRNSGCKVVLDFDFFVVEDTLWLREVGPQDPYWLSPNERVTADYERACASLGKSPEHVVGLVCPYAWLNYPPRRTSALRDPSKADTINIRQAYGGGTNGVPAPWKYGKTTGYTANPFQDKFSRQDWLITHEFHHQIDALMDVSGYPEYYHADQPWKMPGRFGEDFDFNAQIIRNAGQAWWLNLKFGTLMETRDADHDGVPDDHPSLPFDERRLSGDPTKKDTDGDGLNDLEEVMAGGLRGSALNGIRTDHDRLVDGEDPEPLYDGPSVVRQLPTQLSSNNIPLRLGFPDYLWARKQIGETLFQIYMAWDDSLFYIGYLAPQRANLLVQIDANSDGWFHGFDNLQIRVHAFRDTVDVVDYYLRDCSSWSDPPKDRKDVPLNPLRAEVWDHTLTFQGWIQPESDTIATRRTPVVPSNKRSQTGLLLRIPETSSHGLDFHAGKNLAIRIGLQTEEDRWVWEELFERNYMMPIELK